MNIFHQSPLFYKEGFRLPVKTEQHASQLTFLRFDFDKNTMMSGLPFPCVFGSRIENHQHLLFRQKTKVFSLYPISQKEKFKLDIITHQIHQLTLVRLHFYTCTRMWGCPFPCVLGSNSHHHQHLLSGQNCCLILKLLLKHQRVMA